MIGLDPNWFFVWRNQIHAVNLDMYKKRELDRHSILMSLFITIRTKLNSIFIRFTRFYRNMKWSLCYSFITSSTNIDLRNLNDVLLSCVFILNTLLYETVTQTRTRNVCDFYCCVHYKIRTMHRFFIKFY